MKEWFLVFIKDYFPAIISIITVSFLIWNNIQNYSRYKSIYANNVAVWPADETYKEKPIVNFYISNSNKTPIYNVFIIRGKRQYTVDQTSINSDLLREDVAYSRLIMPGEYKYFSNSIAFKGMEMGKGGLPEEFAILFTDSSGHKWMRDSDGKLNELDFNYFDKITKLKNLHAPLGDLTLIKQN
ncbi:hypothetical protein [Leuconostoc mesenteroides]|uniref:hypothetical protein n=1 Tax=Leuconostoc mesenteroides TaxID=1245 RepID=UPI0020791BAB|nr:hypothetical protein [Leuconostoc mesenteroides]USI45366.1 hypothetical protein M0D19_07675 [Leuconostoc mesenteroides]